MTDNLNRSPALQNLDNLKVSEFLEQLALPRFPGPAAGSAAAASAAMAAALLEMACLVTMNKDELKRDLQNYIKESKIIRQNCLSLATEDMVAYAEVVKAIKLKREFPVEYEAAMKNATDTLVSLIKECNSILTLIAQMVNTCYKSALGELYTGAYLAAAAAAAAQKATEVNLKLLNDESYKKEVLNFILETCKTISETKERIIGK